MRASRSVRPGRAPWTTPSGMPDMAANAGRSRIYTVTGRLHSRSDADYRLNVGGAVDTPFTLTVDDLRAMPAARFTKDFQCVTGWRVHDVKWAGVRLSDLLDKAGVRDGAQGLPSTSSDGAYTESLT